MMTLACQYTLSCQLIIIHNFCTQSIKGLGEKKSVTFLAANGVGGIPLRKANTPAAVVEVLWHTLLADYAETFTYLIHTDIFSPNLKVKSYFFLSYSGEYLVTEQRVH